ncbi:PAS domain S-box protein [Halochromatium roseum]|uniref:PAS domain S-box protein n=1 Tax=Halochromatium roseum TaxID=391920 RepID=UPI0019134504|nr:PAS domain S-box protein [Halochromatium roseum]MBK5940069.1 hypothetical protein [Halochromatium roseum]
MTARWRYGRRLLLLLSLMVLAVAGNHFNLSLFFGVNLIFGSIAVWLALAWLGALPAILVATSAAFYTNLLWDQSSAFLIFVAEAVFVVGLVQWRQQRGRERDIQPLIRLVGLYWLLIGLPAILGLYRHTIDLPLIELWLLALKQPLNGILNAVLAQLILLGVALLRQQPLSGSLRQLLFRLLLAAMLVPVMALIAVQNQDQRHDIESELRDRLHWFAEFVSLSLERNRQSPLIDTLADLEQELAALLPASAQPSLALISAQERMQEPSQLQVEGLWLRAPGQHAPTLIKQWRAARYRVEIPLPRTAAADWLVVEVSATLVIDEFHARLIRLFGLLLGLVLIAALIAELLSRVLTRPLDQLNEVASQLGERIRAGQPMAWLQPTAVLELERLAQAIQRMGANIADNFSLLQQEHDALSLARERYRLVIDNLEDLIVRTDAQGCLEFVSPSYCRLFGRGEAELIGQVEQSYQRGAEPEEHRASNRHDHPEPATALHWPTDQHRREQFVFTARGWRWLQWLDRPVVDAHGRVRSVVSLGRDITEQKSAEQDLAQREAIEHELIQLATDFALPDFALKSSQRLDALIDQSLARMGRFTHSDRAYLFQFTADGVRLSKTHEWVAPDVASRIDQLQDLAADQFSAAITWMRKGASVVVPRVADLGEDWAEERKVLERQGIQSVHLVPIIEGQRLAGFIGFGAVVAPRTWLSAEMHMLQILARLLVGAFSRARIHSALVKSQERYEQVARQSRSVAWEVDAEGRYTYLSPVIEDLLGYRPEQLVGKRYFYDLFPAAERERLKTKLMTLLEQGQPSQALTNVLQHADGSLLWVNSDGLPIVDDQGQIQGYRGIDFDISARHCTEQQLRASESRLAAILDQAPIGIATADQEVRLMLVNQAMSQLLGYRQTELIGKGLDAFTHPEDLQRERPLYAELLAGVRSQYRMRKRYLKSTGEIVWADLRVVLIPQEQNHAPILLGMFEDITEVLLETERRRQAEQALDAYTRQLEQLLDLGNRALSFEQEVEALLALSCRDLRMAFAELALIKDDATYERHARYAVDTEQRVPTRLGRRLLARCRAHHCMAQVITSDQLPRRCREAGWRSALLITLDYREPNGQTQTLALSFWSQQQADDVSALDREPIWLVGQRLAALLFEEQARQLLMQTKQRETIGHLASGVAHDFNNLLSVIRGNLQYLQAALQRLPAHPELHEFDDIVDETLSALGQATVITAGMLSLNRTGGIRISPTQLGPAIDELCRILQHILPARIQLELQLVPDLRAETNLAFLQSALLNLALNARDAMPKAGTLSIRAQPRRWSGTPALAVGELIPGDYVEVSVADTGCGMGAKTLSRLFEPLFSTKAKQRGHGLGLFMVQQFALRSGAGLVVESTPGQGAVFRLLLRPCTDRR